MNLMDEIKRRQESAHRQAVSYRNYRRVRDRALRRLSTLYPDQYRELFEEERARDASLNKVWLDITGRTNASVGLSASDGTDKSTEGPGDSEQERELGRKA